MGKYTFAIFVCIITLGCANNDTSPRPIGYNRIDRIEPTYIKFNYPHFSFSTPSIVKADSVYSENNDGKWFNIVYPSYKARLYCSYNQIKDHSELVKYLNDSHKLAYSHTLMADGIEQTRYINKNHNTYGIVYEIEGNVATPIQFFLTDSVSNFFRASLYYDSQVNEDSVAPITQFIKDDIIKMIESFEWK